MRNGTLFGLTFFAIAQFTLAATPPPAPAQIAPFRTPPPAAPSTRPPLARPVTWNREWIESLHLSGTVTRDLLHQLNARAQDAASESTVDTEAQLGSPLPQTDATALGTAQATNDTAHDIEPSVITNRFSGVDRTTAVFTKISNSVPRHYWTSTTDYVNFTGFPTGTALALPQPLPGQPPYTRSSDPMLTENPYTIGAHSKRTYCVGVSYDAVGGQLLQNALTVWWTDNPGSQAWTATAVARADKPLFFDKPSIFTSWDMNHGTLGYTYIAVVALHTDTGLKDIYVYMQGAADGFIPVNTTQFVYMDPLITSPIITVDSATGDVYLLWVDGHYDVVQIARSTNMGQSFTILGSASLGNTLSTNRLYIEDDAGQQIRVKAQTTIMARPNAADNSIGMVWHNFESDFAHTDAGFNRFQLGTQSWTYWRGILAGHRAPNDRRDQWNAALDPAADGTYLIQWYDKRDDATNNTYRVYAERVRADGSAFDTTDTRVYATAFGANPALLTPEADGLRYLGEYQDVWEWYGTWYGATIYINQTGNEDVYITRVNP